jgi:hypothetical protein
VWAKAGDAMLVSATAAMKTNFDVLIINPSLRDGLQRRGYRRVVRRTNEANFRKYRLLQAVDFNFSSVFTVRCWGAIDQGAPPNRAVSQA